jgi:hypothetical protein
MKTLTIDGRRYRLHMETHYGRVIVRGKGLLVGVYLPEGVTLDSPDLRECVAAAIAADRECARRARETVRQNLCEHDVRTGPVPGSVYCVKCGRTGAVINDLVSWDR